MADGSIKIDTRIKKEGAQSDFKELQKTINAQIRDTEREIEKTAKSIDSWNDKLSETNNQIANLDAEMDGIINDATSYYKHLLDAGAMTEKQFDAMVQKKLDSNKQYQALIEKQTILSDKANMYQDRIGEAAQQQNHLNTILDSTRARQTELNANINNGRDSVNEKARGMNNVARNTRRASVQSLGLGKNLQGSLKSLARMSLVLLGFGSIMMFLRRTTQDWMNSNSEAARQLRADMDNLRMNIGSALTPVLEGVLNIFNRILAVVGAIVQAFAGINIFARNTARSSAQIAGSSGRTARNAQNQLASFDQINVLQRQDAGGGGRWRRNARAYH